MSHAVRKHWVDNLPIVLLGIRSAIKLTLALPNLSIGLHPGSKHPQPHAFLMRRRFSILVYKRVPMPSFDVTGQAVHFNPIIMVRIKCIHGVRKLSISVSYLSRFAPLGSKQSAAADAFIYQIALSLTITSKCSITFLLLRLVI